MYFSLPKDMSAPTHEITMLLTSLPLDADRIVDNTFIFTNRVWDEIENEIENPTESYPSTDSDRNSTTVADCQNGVELLYSEVNSRIALKWILLKAQLAGALLLTRLSPDEWINFYDEVSITVRNNLSEIE